MSSCPRCYGTVTRGGSTAVSQLLSFATRAALKTDSLRVAKVCGKNEPMKYGYARTRDQNPALQIEALHKARCAQIFEEKRPGANMNCPTVARCLKTLRAGDTLIVWKPDRPLAIRTASASVGFAANVPRSVHFENQNVLLRERFDSLIEMEALRLHFRLHHLHAHLMLRPDFHRGIFGAIFQQH